MSRHKALCFQWPLLCYGSYSSSVTLSVPVTSVQEMAKTVLRILACKVIEQDLVPLKLYYWCHISFR